jgi:protease-4
MLQLRLTLIAVSLSVVALFTTPGPARGAAASKPQSKPQSPPTVAIFELDTPIMESSAGEGFPFGPQPVTLRELVRRINDAAADDNIKGVVILCDNVMAGRGQVEELRQAIAHVREKNKDVFVHSDSMTLREYVLFSSASRISVVPNADLWVNGIYGESVYLRGLLDKIGVQPDFEHIGPWKSASELFTREGPSKEADAMMNWLVDSLYQSIIDDIAGGRKVSADKVKQWMDKGPYNAEQAKSAGLIDAIEHRQDFDAMLKKKYGEDLVYDRRYGVEKQPTIDLTNPFAFFKILGEILGQQKKPASTQPSVAIVYVDGPIIPGSERGSIFGSGAATSTDIRKALDEAARDDLVKAVVLRVDSPGGSAVASEIILDATKRVKAKKPFVVSMGDVAGSGGYYVACGADTVFADKSTLTASIGVVGGKLVTTDMWKKVGISFHPYSRGEKAGMLSTDAPFTEAERAHIKQWMQEIYGTFTKHVLEARKDKLKKPIEEIAQGRVYTGQQALELGLVDKIGTLDDAIHFAADRAGVKDYGVRVIPKPKNFLEKLMEEGAGGSDSDNKWVANPSSLSGLAMPYLRGLDPRRVGQIMTALQSLQLLEHESVILTMPLELTFK